MVSHNSRNAPIGASVRNPVSGTDETSGYTHTRGDVMKTFGLFHGGHNFAVGGHADIESFDSLKSAKSTFECRADFDPFYPCTDETAEMWLWFAMPEDNGDLYPAAILTLGKRGGVRYDKC